MQILLKLSQLHVIRCHLDVLQSLATLIIKPQYHVWTYGNFYTTKQLTIQCTYEEPDTQHYYYET